MDNYKAFVQRNGLRKLALLFLVYELICQNRRIIPLQFFSNCQPSPDSQRNLTTLFCSLPFPFQKPSLFDTSQPFLTQFPSAQLNNMSRFLLMQNSRVLLEEMTPSCEQLSLKLCTNRQIIKLPSSFHWSDSCQRWQSITHIRFEYFLEYPLELQFYLQRDKLPQVIGESTIQPPIFSHHLNEQIKVLISYDGLVTGWLYCQFAFEGEDTKAKEERFLSLQKVNLTFLEEIEEDIKVEIKRNTESIFEKVVKLTQRGKTLFPNIRMPVKVSDVIRMEITAISQVIKPIMFLVDRIKRGKSSTIQFWLRNKHKNKTGSITVEYFMENLYLENERHMRPRNAIIPDSLEYVKTMTLKRIADKEKDQPANEKDKQQLVVRKKLEEVDKRILKINNGVNEMLREMRKEDTIPFLKRPRPNRKSQLLDPAQKDKVSFYFKSK